MCEKQPVSIILKYPALCFFDFCFQKHFFLLCCRLIHCLGLWRPPRLLQRPAGKLSKAQVNSSYQHLSKVGGSKQRLPQNGQLTAWHRLSFSWEHVQQGWRQLMFWPKPKYELPQNRNFGTLLLMKNSCRHNVTSKVLNQNQTCTDGWNIGANLRMKQRSLRSWNGEMVTAFLNNNKVPVGCAKCSRAMLSLGNPKLRAILNLDRSDLVANQVCTIQISDRDGTMETSKCSGVIAKVPLRLFRIQLWPWGKAGMGPRSDSSSGGKGIVSKNNLA